MIFSAIWGKKRSCFYSETLGKVIPARVVEMWVMGRDSNMLVDIGLCKGALEGSGGSSMGTCRSVALSVSSVLLSCLGDKHCAGGLGSNTTGATGGTGGTSSEALANSERNGQDMNL